MKTYLFLGAVALLVASTSGLASAGGFQCPNTRACNVDARTVDIGPTERCGVGLTLFGFDVSIGGPKCPQYRHHYPAHQECHGAENGGTLCALEQMMQVERERCECERVGALGTGISIPECDCDEQGNAGMIEDFKTERCFDLHPPAEEGPRPPSGGGEIQQ
jgi:hypothetical protein